MFFSSNLEKSLHDLHDGHIDAATFFRDTDGVWRTLAAYLLRRWPAPAWVDVDEIAQELRVGVWHHMWRYQGDRGTGLQRFAIWNAIDYAKKKLHRMRGAKLCGSADRNPSRYEIPLSTFDASPEWVEGMLVTDGEQFAAVERSEALQRALGACQNETESYAVRALHATGGIASAAELLDSSRDARFACAITEPESAPQIVASAIEAVADRLQQVAA